MKTEHYLQFYYVVLHNFDFFALITFSDVYLKGFHKIVPGEKCIERQLMANKVVFLDTRILSES